MNFTSYLASILASTASVICRIRGQRGLAAELAHDLIRFSLQLFTDRIFLFLGSLPRFDRFFPGLPGLLFLALLATLYVLFVTLNWPENWNGQKRLTVWFSSTGASSPPRHPRQLPWLIFETIINQEMAQTAWQIWRKKIHLFFYQANKTVSFLQNWTNKYYST